MGKRARINAKNGTSPSLSQYSEEVRGWVGWLIKSRDALRLLIPQPSVNGGRTAMMFASDGGTITFAKLAELTGLDPDQVAWALHFLRDKRMGNTEFSGYRDYRAKVDALLAK